MKKTRLSTLRGLALHWIYAAGQPRIGWGF